MVQRPSTVRRPELLAPGGDRDAALAALQYGADAVYCGLQKFSARAEAINFSPAQLGELAAFAHSLTPRRSVFVTVNTVVLNRERAELAAALDSADQAGVDAVIVQDLGVARIVRRWFPRLALHASTQLAVHNLAGAETLRQLGFRRVTLARELSLEEIRGIAAQAGLETEVFIHGALCYAYSGLCLFSSQLRGRSGNRGRCAYPCRDIFRPAAAAREAATARGGFLFSMKDLALPEHLAALRNAGVASLKIEGRRKQALYVAATTAYYRRLLDGGMSAAERQQGAADLQTIFSRPWTALHLQGPHPAEVVDRDIVGHRGAPIGAVEDVISYGRGAARLRFHTRRALERHDGLQIDLPGVGQPFGFPVDALHVVGGAGRSKTAFAAPAGSFVEVELPYERPDLPAGAPIYCASSQAVKRSFPIHRPKPGAFRRREPLAVTLTLSPERLEAVARLATDAAAGEPPLAVTVTRTGALAPAQDQTKLPAAARSAFEKLGDTPFRLDVFELHNPRGCFVPVSMLNDVRRQLCADLAAAVEHRQAERLARIRAAVAADGPPDAPATAPGVRWLLRVDQPACLETFEPADWQDVAEVLVAADGLPLPELQSQLERLAERIGAGRIRLALPVITRSREEPELLRRLGALRAAGWQAFEAANVSAWSFLRRRADETGPAAAGLDLTADWPLYTLNASAAAQWLELGARRVTLSPEDGLDNLRELLPRCGDRTAVIVYQDTPLFISEACPTANLAGRCPSPARCTFTQLDLDSGAGERLTVWNRHCRTITISRQPFCVSHRLAALREAGARVLRVDFVLRPYTAAEARRLWREIRAGRALPGTHPGNFDRGLL